MSKDARRLGPWSSRTLQALQKIDDRGVDLGRAFLLGPVAAARQHDRLAQLRHEFREVRQQLVHAGERYDEVAVAGDVQRRYIDGLAGERRRQLPVAVDVAVPVEPAANPVRVNSAA